MVAEITPPETSGAPVDEDFMIAMFTLVYLLLAFLYDLWYS